MYYFTDASNMERLDCSDDSVVMRNKTKAAWQEIMDTFIYENLNEAEKAEIAKHYCKNGTTFLTVL
ncbi:unnamed protein product [Acanthoscelides obtectus]|uniref:Uncharacterized protein n=1 Tax=Acanthoscelides obtectus TaxID=200917 RepID=A0A9P0VS25_ACAOB|nr:unnamed protein product [Acanthoscelides obtectus]CAK1688172.1 hypothetical protein AOBTE_LOCUS36580 [Acanthoscelides obtectus]